MSWKGDLKAHREAYASARDEAKRLANDCSTDGKTREKVDASLKAQGLDADSIIAEAFVGGIGHMEALDRMTASAEARRIIALREIERRRNALGRALRQASDQIIKGEALLVPQEAG